MGGQMETYSVEAHLRRRQLSTGLKNYLPIQCARTRYIDFFATAQPSTLTVQFVSLLCDLTLLASDTWSCPHFFPGGTELHISPWPDFDCPSEVFLVLVYWKNGVIHEFR